MIDLYYAEHFLSLGKGEQFDPKFGALPPNNKIPAIVDHDRPGGKPVSVFESGCILIYLAEKTGRFLPTEPCARIETLEWLFWQIGGFGPMLGQVHHFRAYAPERIQYGYDRYTNEAGRLYGVLDARLDGRDYVAAGEYTIADFANVKRWFEAIAARPAVAGDMEKLEDKADRTEGTEERWSNLFGAEQYRQR